VAPFTDEAASRGNAARRSAPQQHRVESNGASIATSPDAVSPVRRGAPDASFSPASFHYDASMAASVASEARQRRADVRKAFLPSTWITADLGEVNRNVQPPTTKRYHRVLAERLTADGMLRGDDSSRAGRAAGAGDAPPESELVLATRSQLATGFGGWAIRTSDILTVCPGVVRKLPQFSSDRSSAMNRSGHPDEANPLLRGASLSELGGVSPVIVDKNNALPFATAAQDLSITIATRRHVIVLEFESRPDKDAWLRRLMTLRARNAQSPGWLLGFPEQTAPGEAQDLYAPTPRRGDELPASVARRLVVGAGGHQPSFGSPSKAGAGAAHGGARRPFLFEAPSPPRHDGEGATKSPRPAMPATLADGHIRALGDRDAVAVNGIAGGLHGIPSATEHVPASVIRGCSPSTPSVLSSSRRLTVASELDSDEEDVDTRGRKVPGTLASMLAGLGTDSPMQQVPKRDQGLPAHGATPPLGFDTTPPMVSVPPTPVSRRRHADIEIDIDDDDGAPPSGLFPVRGTPGRGVSPGSILPSALRTPTSVTDAEHSSL
jgi:hypothetical protein